MASLRVLLVLLALVIGEGGSPAVPAGGQSGGETAGIAWQLVEWPSGRVLQSVQPNVLSRPSLPGSILKLPALIAALESGTITPGTRIACPGYAEVDGRRIACLHPRVRRPLGPAEALAYSCNAYFATVGQRLGRERLSAVLTALGLPPVPASRGMSRAATGLEGSPVPPGHLLKALQQVLADPPGVAMRSPTRAVVTEGLRGAALFGTASAFSARGIEALAKTGTAEAPGGAQQGLVVAAWPATRPTRAVVVVAAGGSGSDAAEVAARIAKGERPGAAAPAAPAATRRGPASSGAATRPVPASPTAVPVPTAPGPSASRGQAVPLSIRVGVLQRNGRHAVHGFPIEEYVARVLAGEAAPRSPAAALEALAVTARTFALANRRRHARDGFDLCDTTHCQVLREAYPAATAAAAGTAGQLLLWQGTPAGVFYTASCGGRTERPSSVWPGALDPPYLPSRPDHGCAGEPRWSSEIPAADLLRALRAAGYRGDRLRDVRIRGRHGSGRVSVLEIKGLEPDRISGQDLRMAVGRTLGWQLLKSTEFELERGGSAYRFRGRGFGHGVGLCVIGATRRAAAGETRAQLLSAYFPGVRVGALASTSSLAAPATRAPESVPLASGEAVDAAAAPAEATRPGSIAIRVQLPDGDARERPALLERAQHILVAATARTGRPAPPDLHLVVHPTVQSFRRETGEPWWTAALTRGSRIDLQPIAVLVERRLLEAALAHELGHVLTYPVTKGRAAWVQEGAAMFAGGLIDESDVAGARGSGRSSCPSDDELRRPVSAGTAAEAYGRARACFTRALATGRTWEEVR